MVALIWWGWLVVRSRVFLSRSQPVFPPSAPCLRFVSAAARPLRTCDFPTMRALGAAQSGPLITPPMMSRRSACRQGVGQQVREGRGSPLLFSRAAFAPDRLAQSLRTILFFRSLTCRCWAARDSSAVHRRRWWRRLCGAHAGCALLRSQGMGQEQQCPSIQIPMKKTQTMRTIMGKAFPCLALQVRHGKREAVRRDTLKQPAAAMQGPARRGWVPLGLAPLQACPSASHTHCAGIEASGISSVALQLLRPWREQ